MSTTTIEDAQRRLSELVDQMAPDEEVIITRDGKPVARLLPPAPAKGVRVLGRGKGKLINYVEDDDHLKDFEDYMP